MKMKFEKAAVFLGGRWLKFCVSLYVLLLLLVQGKVNVHAVVPEADAVLDTVTGMITGAGTAFAIVLGVFGAIKLGVGVSQNTPSDKQQGVLSLVGAAVIGAVIGMFGF